MSNGNEETENEETEDQENTKALPFPEGLVTYQTKNFPGSNYFPGVRGVRFYGKDDKESLDSAFAEKRIDKGYLAAAATGARGSRASVGSQNLVVGDALLDDENYLVRAEYTLDQDTAELQMLKFNPTDLATLAKQMQRTGFYTSGEPSGLILSGRGYSATDINAFVNLLRFSNSRHLIVQSVAKQLSGLSSVAGEGTKVKVTAEEDIRYYLEQAFLSRMGRKPTRKDIDDGIAAVQANERKMAAMGRSAPSVAVATKVQAEKGHGAEGAAYQLGNAIKLAFAHLGGG